MNSNTRAITKTITWRVIATIITGIIVYSFTGKFEETGRITVVVAVFLTVGYYIHEKLWQRR